MMKRLRFILLLSSPVCLCGCAQLTEHQEEIGHIGDAVGAAAPAIGAINPQAGLIAMVVAGVLGAIASMVTK